MASRPGKGRLSMNITKRAVEKFYRIIRDSFIDKPFKPMFAVVNPAKPDILKGKLLSDVPEDKKLAEIYIGHLNEEILRNQENAHRFFINLGQSTMPLAIVIATVCGTASHEKFLIIAYKQFDGSENTLVARLTQDGLQPGYWDEGAHNNVLPNWLPPIHKRGEKYV